MPYHPPLKILLPRGPSRVSKYPKMGVRVRICGIFLYVKISYYLWEILQFFPDLWDTRGPLGGLQGPRGGPPEGVCHIGTFW